MSQSVIYQITVKESLDESWRPQFENMTLDASSGNTTIMTGEFRDQAALHGVLAKIRDFGLTLLDLHFISQIFNK